LDLAHEALDRLSQLAAAVDTDAMRAGERAAAGGVALAERAPDRARAALEDAVDLYERCRTPFEAAGARADLARALAAEDRGDAALELAVAAASAFQGLGARRAARDADRLVGHLGGLRTAAKRGGLTRREVEVLALVAQGLSNPQIAERLF